MEFTLRNWQHNDLENLVKYANNYNIAKNLTNQFPYPYTAENALGFIKMAMADKPTRIFCIAVDNESVGAIGIHPQTDIMCKNAELGYWLGEPFWGNGIISKAIKQMLKYGFETFDINRIFARPFGSNIGSQKALEKAGFALEARFEKTIFKYDKFEDELVYAFRR
ncbi:MAG: N-acetyltransferase [Sphingobacteriales bacterium]|nr:MAG: N-acetyltransferase [Sphingobacteriales bacterium]